MTDSQTEWIQRVHAALKKTASELGIDGDLPQSEVVTETPPSSQLGDLAFPMFPFARQFRTSPNEIASKVSSFVDAPSGTVSVAGSYVNVRFDRPREIRRVLTQVLTGNGVWGESETLAGTRVMVEFSCPNTNKPLHLGHLRNDALGESVSRILRAAGAEVRQVNLINDRGVHICQSMLAYQERGAGSTPEKAGRKSDHFVGDWYVEFQKLVKEDEAAKERASQLLREWEKGSPEVLELWKRMNDWAISGIEQTYRATDIHFDQVYYESQTYKSGRQEILQGLERGVFYKDDDGSIWVDLTDEGLDKKVLLRGDGTSLYITQDIGTAIARQKDWVFDRLVYVVASEQRYHFQVLFHVLRRLGFGWSENLFHLAYGMVNLPTGRMKSREGTVVDADDLLAQMQRLAVDEIEGKGRADVIEDVDETSRKIAVGALHYYLLNVSPNKDMVFDPSESISFNGNTGPYLQYTGARISSMVRKSDGAELVADDAVDPGVLVLDEEWGLAKQIALFPGVVARSADEYNPTHIASHLYETAKLYSRYYHDHPILTNPDVEIRSARLMLSRGVLEMFRAGLPLIAVPFLDAM